MGRCPAILAAAGGSARARAAADHGNGRGQPMPGRTAWHGSRCPGPLGGGTVAGVLALVDAGRSDLAQRRRGEQQHQFDVNRELRTARLACYVRYIVSAQAVYDRSCDLYVANSKAPIDPSVFSVRLPPEPADELVRNQTCRVEVLLVAGERPPARLRRRPQRPDLALELGHRGRQRQPAQDDQAPDVRPGRLPAAPPARPRSLKKGLVTITKYGSEPSGDLAHI